MRRSHHAWPVADPLDKSLALVDMQRVRAGGEAHGDGGAQGQRPAVEAPGAYACAQRIAASASKGDQVATGDVTGPKYGVRACLSSPQTCRRSTQFASIAAAVDAYLQNPDGHNAALFDLCEGALANGRRSIVSPSGPCHSGSSLTHLAVQRLIARLAVHLDQS